VKEEAQRAKVEGGIGGSDLRNGIREQSPMVQYDYMPEQQNINDHDILEFGEPLLQWEVDEYPQHERTRTWYLVAGIIGVALIVYAIATANFLFAVIILMIGVIMLLSTFKIPDRIDVMITTAGVIVDDMFYDYKTLRDFSIVYDPPQVSLLYLDFHTSWHPMIAVPLEDHNPNEIREVLLRFCPENLHRDEESLTDLMKRLYKLG
jgi:hypothetical protein